MPYAFDYEPSLCSERDAAVKWFRSQARAAQRLLKRANDPHHTPMSPEFTAVIELLLDKYRASLKRLVKDNFTTRR